MTRDTAAGLVVVADPHSVTEAKDFLKIISGVFQEIIERTDDPSFTLRFRL